MADDARRERIPITVHPAYLGLGEALRGAWRYWRATTQHWILAVVAVALVNALAVAVLGGAVISAEQLRLLLVNGPLGPEVDTAQLPRVIAGPTAVALITLVANWFLVANAVAGLRGRGASTIRVVLAGLRAFAADMLVVLVVVVVGAFLLGFGALGIVVLLGLVPVAVYVGIRLTFWTLAIFDGASVLGGADVSWRITRGGVLRVFGWALALAAIGLPVAVALTVLDYLALDVPIVSAVAGGTVQTALTAYTVIVLALQYESQRLRTDPVAYRASLPPASAPDPSEAGPLDHAPPAEPD